MAALRARIGLATLVLAAAFSCIAIFLQSAQTSPILVNQLAVSPQPDMSSLQNGLRVVVVPMSDADKTVLMAWYSVGGADDPSDKPGLAHYVEHATMAALGDHDGVDPKFLLKPRRPLTAEAMTSDDLTAYYYIITPEQLDVALRLELERLDSLIIDDVAVEAERQSVLDERVHEIEADESALLEEHLRVAAFAGSPYSRPVVAPTLATDRITGEDVRTFWRRWYGPGNLVLVVAGRVNASEIRARVEDLFSEVGARETPRRERPIARPSHQRVTAVDPNFRADILWSQMYVAPSFGTGEHRESLSLHLLARVLAAPESGLLSRTLRERRLAKDVTIDYVPDSVGQTPFTIRTALVQNANVSQVEEMVDQALSRIVSNGISVDDLTQAREGALKAAAEVWNDPFEVASMIGAALQTGRDLTDVIQLPRAISRITAEDVRTAAARLISNGQVVTGSVQGATGKRDAIKKKRSAAKH